MKTIDVINNHIEQLKNRERAEWQKANFNNFKKERVKNDRTFSEDVDMYRKDVIKELTEIKVRLEAQIVNTFKNISFDYVELSRDESLYGYDDTATFDITVYYEKEENDSSFTLRLDREFEKYWATKLDEYVNIYVSNSNNILIEVNDVYSILVDTSIIYELYYTEASLKNRDKYISRINDRQTSKEKISYISTLINNNIFED